jgi:phosphate transport system protein
MVRHFETELRNLKQHILAMGGNVERAIEIAITALLERKPELFEEVHQLERKVNEAHIQVDEECLKLLARQSPLAADLRLVFAIIKINSDLERMGDQAVNIAMNGKRYLSEPALKPLIDIPRMAKEAQFMVREALDSLVTGNLTTAHDVLKRDDTVDAFKSQIFRELITYMIADPRTIERALELILIARNLERIGDHATNIAEDVIFAITGLDVRHGGNKSQPATENPTGAN